MTAQELEKLLSEVTPGEWAYRSGKAHNGNYHIVEGDDGDVMVCECWDNDDGTDKINARLIAMAPTLARRVIVAEKLVEALQTAKDYVDDASRGKLRYLGMSDISEMAGDDLVFIQAAIDEWDAAK